MSVGGTLNRADVYGSASSAGAVVGQGVGTVQVTGPNQSSVTGASQAGGVGPATSNGAAFSWAGFVIALILLRIALEAGGEAR